MFKNDLQKRFERIFGFKKTTYLAPSDKFEQDTLFITVQTARTKVSDAEGGRETAKVTGFITVYSQDNRLPFGFFSKRINAADPSDTERLFFFDMEVDKADSPARLQNIHERSIGFVFLYDSQFDPDKGSLTSLEIED